MNIKEQKWSILIHPSAGGGGAGGGGSKDYPFLFNIKLSYCTNIILIAINSTVTQFEN